MKNWIHLYLQEVLDKDRLKILNKLVFFKEKWFYLAWWTALALQIGHRQSIDFDFFILEDINTEKLYIEILKKFKGEDIIKTFEENNTLYIEFNRVKISFMTYKYPLLEDLIKTDYLNIVSQIDIWCMKLWAIQNRATNKDYVDLFYIFKEYSLKFLIKPFYQKFWKVINENLISKSIVYFDDIENEELILNEKIDFNIVKENLIKLVNKY